MRRRKGTELLVVVALTVGVGAVIGWHQAIQREILVGLLAVIAPMPLVVRAAQRRFDPFEPITILSLGVCVLFVFRPLAQILSGEMRYRGYNVEPGFDKALLVALIGVISLYIGYVLPVAARAGRRFRPLRDDWDPSRASEFAAAALIFGLVLVAGFIDEIGGLEAAQGLLLGRTTEEGRILADASGYLYSGLFIAVPATLIFIEAASRNRRMAPLFFAGFSALLVVIVTGPRGDRSLLLAMLTSVVILVYLRRQRRPRTIRLVVAAAIVFLLGVTFLREVRIEERAISPGELLTETVQHPLRAVEDFILADDTEMLAVLSAEVQEIPRLRPFSPGVTLASLAAAPIPGSLWPDKPQAADVQIYSYLFPQQARITRAGPAPSMFGGFWYDLGFSGVILGSLLVGAVARMSYAYLLANRDNASVRLLYAAAFPLTLVLLRGNPTDTLSRALYLVGPVILCICFTSPRGGLFARRRPVGELGIS